MQCGVGGSPLAAVGRYGGSCMSNRPVMPDLLNVDIAAAYKWALEDRQWLEAENARLRDALKEVADGENYPQQVARAALYA